MRGYKFSTLLLVGIACFFLLSCHKERIDQPIQENIQLTEIKAWSEWYQKTLSGAPKMMINRAEKAFIDGRFYVRVPLEGSTGMIYFGKDNSLQAEFIRVVPQKSPVKYPFTGMYELIDLNKFTYTRLNFSNGVLGKPLKGRILNSADNGQLLNSWFSQLLWCLAHYIIAVPAKDEFGDWTNCWSLSGGGSQNQELEPGGESGGPAPPINWASFFMTINPSTSGPDLLPSIGGSGGTWTLYTPPAYIPPTSQQDPWSSINGLVGNTDLENNASFEDLYYIIYKFPINSQYADQYPRFYNLVKNIYSKALQTPKILDALKSYSHMTDKQLYAALKWNSGPTVEIKDINTNYSGPHRYGYFNAKESRNTINMEMSDVVNYETAALSSTQEEAWMFLLMVTLLHETVHYGNNQVGFIEKYEFGDGWEIAVFGEKIDDYNVAVKFVLQKQ
jgi:hypothetical protein